MKALTIVLGLVCALLLFQLYRSSAAATRQAEEAAKSLATQSNLVAELQTRLALEQSNVQVAKEGLSNALAHSAAELQTLSNRLAQANTQLAAAQTQTSAAQAESAGRATRISELEAQRDQLERTAAALQPLQKECAQMGGRLTAAEEKITVFTQELGRLRVDRADLQRQLEDPVFLRRQMAKVNDQEKLTQAAAKAKPSAKPNPRAPLVLEPDGTVRPAAPARTAGN